VIFLQVDAQKAEVGNTAGQMAERTQTTEQGVKIVVASKDDFAKQAAEGSQQKTIAETTSPLSKFGARRKFSTKRKRSVLAVHEQPSAPALHFEKQFVSTGYCLNSKQMGTSNRTTLPKIPRLIIKAVPAKAAPAAARSTESIIDEAIFSAKAVPAPASPSAATTRVPPSVCKVAEDLLPEARIPVFKGGRLQYVAASQKNIAPGSDRNVCHQRRAAAGGA